MQKGEGGTMKRFDKKEWLADHTRARKEKHIPEIQ